MGRPKNRWNPGSLPVHRRPVIDTPLKRWLQKKGLGLMAVAEEMGLSWKTLENYVHGRCMPPLHWAFKIELYTKGGVPASAWLATDLGKEMWKDGSDATR